MLCRYLLKVKFFQWTRIYFFRVVCLIFPPIKSRSHHCFVPNCWFLFVVDTADEEEADIANAKANDLNAGENSIQLLGFIFIRCLFLIPFSAAQAAGPPSGASLLQKRDQMHRNRNPCNTFLMVNMDRRRVRPTTTSHNMAALLALSLVALVYSVYLWYWTSML